MKINEAPEEIYLLPDDRNPNDLSICWYEAPYSTGAIKYTRTDAFIEKACEWLEGHIYEYLKTNRTMNEPDYDPKLIGDFRNYIKGE